MEHVFQVNGMTCGHCEAAVKKALIRQDHEALVSIDRNKNQVVVQGKAERDARLKAIVAEGYETQ